MRTGIVAIYTDDGVSTMLLATSESAHLLKLACREVLEDTAPPINALDRARVDALRELAQVSA